MLIVAHGFYGLNFINLWPPFVGVLLYCVVMKKKVAENIHIAFFATALAPFVSEVLFRYSVGNFNPAEVNVNMVGIVLAVVCGIGVGFIVLPLLPGTTAMHRGFNLYKAGLAIGMLGIFIYSFMYNTLGVETPSVVPIFNPEYYALPYAYRGFMNVFFIVLFGVTFICGVVLSRGRIGEYKKLLKCTGYGTDFSDKFGMSICMINIAVYGFAILVYLNIVFILPEIFPQLPAGVGFTGPTVGVVFAALTFAADGQHPRNVFPIALGYILLLIIVVLICFASNHSIPWTLSTQAYINGLAFATGLCPIAGKYGFRYGVIAGLLSATICTVTSGMHGGFVLYNGGFTAGLSALILMPLLDFYKVEPKYSDDV
jgi:MFS family permease